ncbi:MAG: endonuclease YncB(thermonuclease family) [Lentimonas sp.]|jgi:endonuclease YncB( thermonuclease family)
MKKISNFLFAIFLIIFTYWIFIDVKTPKIQNSSKASKLSFSSKIIAGKAKVIDGDSVVVENNQIRLIGIDAPEFSQKCLDENNREYSCGTNATIFLKKLIDGKQVNCEYEQKDIYNRYLANCYVGGINVNYELIRSGMAIIYNLKEADEVIKYLEIEARNLKKGLWKGSFEEPKDFRRRNKGKR